ncbi:MAG TPA: hypothetical protein VF469_14275 [Kofleriaceae bacterium]
MVADSLRINAQHPQTELWQQEGVESQHWLGETFALEDERAAKEAFRPRRPTHTGSGKM